VYLHNGEVGGSLYVELSDGTEYAYTITSVQVIPVSELDGGGMQDVVYPDLDAHTNRVTLISCGGDFVPYANGGGAGEYTSRVVLTAERYVP
jgi:sortase (surface protein transpeptidase)